MDSTNPRVNPSGPPDEAPLKGTAATAFYIGLLKLGRDFPPAQHPLPPSEKPVRLACRGYSTPRPQTATALGSGRRLVILTCARRANSFNYYKQQPGIDPEPVKLGNYPDTQHTFDSHPPAKPSPSPSEASTTPAKAPPAPATPSSSANPHTKEKPWTASAVHSLLVQLFHMDATSIVSAFTATRDAITLAKGMASLSNDVQVNSALSDVLSRLIETQNFILQAQSDMNDASRRIFELEQQLKAFQDWDSQAARYELTAPYAGTYVYKLKSDVSPSQPMHYICPACFHKRQISIIQDFSYGSSHGRCYVCHEAYQLAPDSPSYEGRGF